MKLTQPKKVMDIVRPPISGMPAAPAVHLSDSLMQAVELMLKHDLRVIAVISHGRLIGHIQLPEALIHLGLRLPRHLHSGRTPYGDGADGGSSKKE